ncbi:MAG: hypothetical protein O2960_02225 [Verrucomicrobia bacterium]|nr:hypothetical protein [Verrucomicrobiota bacterium]
MKNDPKDILEKVLHRELQKLPDTEAPGTLIPRVSAAIAARAKAAWWRRSWIEWPVQIRVVSFCLSVILSGTFLYGANGVWQRAITFMDTHSFGDQLEPFFAVGRVLETLGRAVLLALQSMGKPEWLISLSVIVLMYGACVVLGSATFQVVTRKR